MYDKKRKKSKRNNFTINVKKYIESILGFAKRTSYKYMKLLNEKTTQHKIMQCNTMC